MPRTGKPWYRRDRDVWVAWLNGRRVWLAKGKGSRAAAFQRYHELASATADNRRTPDQLALGELILAFLRSTRSRVEREELTPETGEFYRRYLGALPAHVRDLGAADLRPHHIDQALEAFPAWNATTRGHLVTSAKRVTRWAFRQGLVAVDPLAALQKPRAKRREVIPTAETVRAAFDAVRLPEFRLFLTVLFETGCRRSEAMRLEARDLDLPRRLWTRKGKTTGVTGRKRVVHLTADLAKMLAGVAKRWPDGPILRDSIGQPWKHSSLYDQVRRIRKRAGLGPEFTFTGLRHLFVTDALERGVPVATVAELVGHRTTKMVMEHYSHLAERQEHLKEALDQVRGKKGLPTTSSQSRDQ